MLTEELQHRIKSLLAIVGSIAEQTLRGEAPLKTVKAIFMGRLMALARAQDILMGKASAEDAIRNVVLSALGPHCEDGRHFILDGPLVRVGPRAMLGLSLVLHELATNAAKYGALSTDRGRVDVRWRIDSDGNRPIFMLEWRETGGPSVSPPTGKGFGTRVIENSLAGYIGGTSNVSYEPSDLTFRHVTLLADMNDSALPAV